MYDDMNTDDTEIRNDSDASEDLDDVVMEDDSMAPAEKLKELREKLKAVQKEKDDNLAGWQRAKADLVNFKRDMGTRSAEEAKYAAKQVLLDLLPVLDSFDMAIASPSWQEIDATWRKGMEGVYQQALSAAKGHGLEQYAPKAGDAFDLNTQEPVGTEAAPTETDDHTVAKVLQKGYALHGTNIRPAKVIIYVAEESK